MIEDADKVLSTNITSGQYYFTVTRLYVCRHVQLQDCTVCIYCMYVGIYVCMDSNMYVCMYVFTVCLFVCVCMFVCMYAFMYICISV